MFLSGFQRQVLQRTAKTLKVSRKGRCNIVRNVMSEPPKLQTEYDAVVIGAGHNGLVSASYLAKAGLRVCVLERRHVIGGAAVTEEIIPGFKFSRASYVLSLLRPQVVQDLELKRTAGLSCSLKDSTEGDETIEFGTITFYRQKYGMKIHLRDPSSYTPLIEPGGRDGKARSLTLGRDHHKTKAQIAQFSERDAERFSEYEAQLERIVAAIDPLIDNAPVYLPHLMGSITDKFKTLPAVTTLLKSLKFMGKDADAFYELMTAPTTKILDKWFESEPLKATLATDSVIGAMMSPKSPGSGYVLLHHVMGELEGIKGAWGYVEGGMGAVSKAICNCATDHGTDVFVNKSVTEILSRNDQVQGVKLEDGTEIKAKAVLSNATPKVTYLNLIKKGILPEDLTSELENFDYTSPVTKINVAVKEIPNFTADPNVTPGQPMPHHRCTIHLNCEHTDLIHQGYLDAQAGMYSRKPMIEMVIPSSLDSTIAPSGAHVCLFFTQYTPYNLTDRQWDEETKNAYADLIFDTVEQYAPGFKASVIGRDILTPPDLEATFGLTGGNIFHGAMSLDQLYMSRPISRFSNYRSPIKGLYLCGSGAHPGGGVMGAAGRLASKAVLSDFKRL